MSPNELEVKIRRCRSQTEEHIISGCAGPALVQVRQLLMDLVLNDLGLTNECGLGT